MSVELQQKTETLHVGLLSMNRREFISPDHDEPALFSAELAKLESVERASHALVGAAGIAASSHYLLRATPDGINKGYLLRESSSAHRDEQEFSTYTHQDLLEYIAATEPYDIRGHFLRQIVRCME